MIIGTAYFPTYYCAMRYYGSYEIVYRKVAEGEIHIGKPELKDNESYVMLDGGLRYGIQTLEKEEDHGL